MADTETPEEFVEPDQAELLAAADLVIRHYGYPDHALTDVEQAAFKLARAFRGRKNAMTGD